MTLPISALYYANLIPLLTVPAVQVNGYYRVDNRGEFTNDENRAIKQVAYANQQWALAETTADFQTLYERLINKLSGENENITHDNKLAIIIEEINRLVKMHTDFGGNSMTNNSLVATARQLIWWLQKNKLEAQPKKIHHPSFLYPHFTIDFENLSDSIITDIIINYFDNMLLSEQGKDSYQNWEQNLRNKLKQLPSQDRLQTLLKGLEYGEKAFDVAKRTLSGNMDGQWTRECFEKRLSIALAMLEEMQPVVKPRLIDLQDNNDQYDQLINQYAAKIQTISRLGMTEEEFVEQELKRIHTLFLPASLIFPHDPKASNHWSPEPYRATAYKMLRMGRDYTVNQLLDNAEKEFRRGRAGETERNIVFSRMSVLNTLKEGVAYIKYEQFLQRKQKENSNESPLGEKSFIQQLIKGIRLLQTQDDKHLFIKELKEENKKNEGAFRDWFSTYFSFAHHCEAESLKGNGRIDLKVTSESVGTRIIEFKGWWNVDRKTIASQLVKYLTDFENSGYIILINNNKSDIINTYKDCLTTEESKYVSGSWKETKSENSDYIYHSSDHRFGNKIKTLYHFIFRVYP